MAKAVRLDKFLADAGKGTRSEAVSYTHLVLFTARGTRSEIMAKIQEKNPLFSEVLPLTLEEIFISETEDSTAAEPACR